MANSKFAAFSQDDPKSRSEALSRSDKNDWQRAMDEEYNALLQDETWEIVSAPNDRNIVTCKWVFKTKKDENGGLGRYKARLVARGFSQKFGTDYDEIFAPVIKQATFKLLLAIAGKQKLLVKHFDAKTAFLNGELKETIYMKQPQAYEVTKKEQVMVCKLKKGLYGLKQAANIWNKKLDSILKSNNFMQGSADPCL